MFLFVLLSLILSLCSCSIEAYRMSGTNLGLTSFLDGGPIRPSPGWYQETYLRCYTTDTYHDRWGDPLIPNTAAPRLTSLATILQATYQFNRVIIQAMPGVGVGFPIILYSTLEPNVLNVVSKQAGFGDLGFACFLQFLPVFYKERPIFINRINLGFTFPVGRTGSLTEITPGLGYWTITPYWAVTFFASKHCALSWRLHYVHAFNENRKTHIHPGDAIYLNFSAAYEYYHNLWLGINGYFLKQVHNNRLSGKVIPNSKERVLGIGGGGMYHFKKHFYLFANIYAECDAQNRPQGINSVLRLVISF